MWKVMSLSTKIKDLVKDKTATFNYYMDGNLCYTIPTGSGPDGNGEFKFYVPLEETKGACFNREMKALTMMRWVRKHMLSLVQGNTTQEDEIVVETGVPRKEE